MINLTYSELAQAVGAKLIFSAQANSNDHFQGVAVDSRKIGSNQLFICLVANRDGHDFIAEMIAKDVKIVLIDKEHEHLIAQFPKLSFGVVEDTLKALGDLAAFWRKKFKGPVLAITGSNGKTTTKEMLRLILEEKYNVLATEGNFNNLIGLPLTLFQLDLAVHNLILLEMGMNQLGEIARLAEISKPTHAAITNIGPAHLENLKNLDTVAQAKGELFQALTPFDFSVINLEDPYLKNLANKSQRFSFGYSGEANCQIVSHTNFADHQMIQIKIKDAVYELQLHLMGEHQILNAALSLSLAYLLEVDLRKACKSLEKYRSSPGRMEIYQLNKGKRLINDCYNANPASMLASLKALKQIAAPKKCLAILGDMNELGEAAQSLHEKLGEQITQIGIDYLITIGKLAQWIAFSAKKFGMNPDRILSFPEKNFNMEAVQNFFEETEVYLVKASRSMQLDSIVYQIKEEF